MEDYIAAALKEDGQLKLIMKGSVEAVATEKIGVVSVVFVTKDVALAKQKFAELNVQKAADDFYMIYSCPVDTYLPKLGHYPSIEISKEDLLN
ncbi:MAG TPA: hypothetical protein H9829_04925 [Candidatus Tetragenococcus pullicola]|nr:hypothetical protein [Candidatus Tetragenococcus pullicola]